MWTSALFGTKTFGFFEIFGVFALTRGGGGEPLQTRGSIFQFCADILYERPPMQKY